MLLMVWKVFLQALLSGCMEVEVAQSALVPLGPLSRSPRAVKELLPHFLQLQKEVEGMAGI